jgi:DNA-binding transcriptional LysR family regulator
MIDVHLLRYALAAADTGSFSRAANQFGIKQSTLSKRIHYLEARLGLPLFQRSTRGVTPTLSGDRFLSKARRILQDIDALAGASRALAKGDEGVLRLGFCGTLATGNLSAALTSYRDACPDVEIEAREGGRMALLNKLEREELDVAILCGQARRPGVRSLSFWNEALVVALPADAPVAVQEPLYWSDLRGYGFAVTVADPGPDIAAMITARLAAPGHLPSIIAQKVSRENLLQLGTAAHLPVTAGIAPDTTSAAGAFSYHEVHDAFGPTTFDQGVHWRTSNANPALQRFLQHLSQRYARPLTL